MLCSRADDGKRVLHQRRYFAAGRVFYVRQFWCTENV